MFPSPFAILCDDIGSLLSDEFVMVSGHLLILIMRRGDRGDSSWFGDGRIDAVPCLGKSSDQKKYRRTFALCLLNIGCGEVGRVASSPWLLERELLLRCCWLTEVVAWRSLMEDSKSTSVKVRG